LKCFCDLKGELSQSTKRQIIMLINYLKLTRRHLWKNKLYSAINVFGLSASIVCVLFAIMYWNDERSFDDFHVNNPNIYRITTTSTDPKTAEVRTTGGTGQVQGPTFKNAVPELKEYVRVLGGEISGDVVANDKALRFKTVFADDNFFRIFSFPFLRGNTNSALSEITSVVITESVAKQFFNSIDVVGKTLSLDSDPSAQRLGKPMRITAVIKDLPSNSSINFDILLPMKFLQLSFTDDNWLNAYLGTYVLLYPNANRVNVIRKFNDVYKVHGHQQLNESIKTYNHDPKIQYGLQPMRSIHLQPLKHPNQSSESGISNTSNPLYSYLFMGIAGFILVMSCINFVNICVANSLKRAKEVGIRKITGGSRIQIISQFLAESAVLCFISFLIAMIALKFCLPFFNLVTNKQISFGSIIEFRLVGSLLIIFLIIVLITGFYPAYILSRYTPTQVLYNKLVVTGKNIFGRSLVVLQVSLAVFLMIATLVYYHQMHFIKSKDLGYDPYQVVFSYISGNRPLPPAIKAIKIEAASEASIQKIAFFGDGNVYEVKLAGQKLDANYLVIDENYLGVMNIPLLIGRNLDPPVYPADSLKSVIVNEAFVKAAKLEHPIGTMIKTDEYFDKEPKTIIGVVKDYHLRSLREPIRPLVMFMNNWYGGGIYAKLEKTKLNRGLAAFEKIYKKAVPGAVYTYKFLDEMNFESYQDDQRWQKIITVSAILSMIICCLGLFGLAHISAHQRQKEIGIRKVLGATVLQILTLISSRFMKLVLIAFIIAVPVSWMTMNKWLENFAYRIDIGAGILSTAGIAAGAMALLAISMQSVKAALSNPVEAIRSDA
jgi:putative ABC transport system permease protein